MKIIFFFIFLQVILTSCSTKVKKQKENKKNGNGNRLDLRENLKEQKFKSSIIKRNSLFNPYEIKEVVFKNIINVKTNIEQDYYKNTLSKSLIGGETLNLLSKFDILKVKQEVVDPISLALISCYQKKYKLAFDKLDNIYFKFNKKPRYWNSLGICYFLKGEYRKSDLYLNKAINLDKRFVPSLNNLGVLSGKRKLYKKSFEHFEKSSKINSFSITPILNKAQLLLKFNLIKNACPIFVNLYSEDSLNKEIGHGYGTCLLFQNKPLEAYNVYKNLKIDYREDEIPFVHYLLSLKLMGNSSEIYELTKGSKLNFKTKYARRIFDFVRSK